MPIRVCDGCHKAFKKEEKRIKCCESQYKDKRQTLICVGDLCLDCWENIKENGRI